jgi:hypothetical protein
MYCSDIYKSFYNNHSSTYPLHHSPLPSYFHSCNSFNVSHFSIFIHNYIIFLLHSASFSLSLYPPSSHWDQPPDRIHFTFLFFVFEKKLFLFICDRSTENFFVTCPDIYNIYIYIYICIYIELDHALQFSPFNISPLLMVISTRSLHSESCFII